MSKNEEKLPDYVDNFKMQNAITCYTLDAKVRVKPLMMALPIAQNSGVNLLDTDMWNTFTIDSMTRGY